MGNAAGEFQFVVEPFDALPVEGDLRAQEFEGDLLADLRVQHAVDLPHTASTQLLHHLVSVGEGGPRI